MWRVLSIRHARVRYEVRVHEEGVKGEFFVGIPLFTDLISGQSLVV